MVVVKSVEAFSHIDKSFINNSQTITKGFGRAISKNYCYRSVLGTKVQLKCRYQDFKIFSGVKSNMETSGNLTEEAVDKILDNEDPIMLSLLKGKQVERPPVWMMRQAGRYMKAYQELCIKYPTFRERSENVDLSVEISLQPWKAFKPDGVILFSDILTPLPGMNIDFDIEKGKGPIIYKPVRTMQDVEDVTELFPEQSCAFVGETLKRLRQEIGNQSTLLGFVGAPYTLAAYIVEGGSSKNFSKLKELVFGKPEILHALLDTLATNITKYIRYQADCGAQAVQIFDSWASNLSPRDFDVFSGRYLKRIITDVKKTHPDLPIILYISESGGLIERMAECAPDVISVCHTVDIIDAINRIGPNIAVQGNLDPAILFGSKEIIEQRVVELVKTVAAVGTRHILNLGHGVTVGTPEENVAHFFKVARSVKERM